MPVVFVRKAQALPGKEAEAIKFGAEIAKMVADIVGVEVMVGQQVGGPIGQILVLSLLLQLYVLVSPFFMQLVVDDAVAKGDRGMLVALGLGFSVPLALLFLCAGAAGAALPIGPAGAATQVGAGAAALIASGTGASQALAVAISVGALGVLTGAATLLFAVAWRTGMSLLTQIQPHTR